MPRRRPLPLVCAVLVIGAALLLAARPAAGPPLGSPAAPLPFFYDLYTFRGADGATDVVAAFAVRAGQLEREKAHGRVRYRFDVSLVLADTATQRVERSDDSVYVDLTRAVQADHLLYTHIEVEAAPSSTTRHRVIMSDATRPGVGQLYSEPFHVRDYRGGALMLSDLAFGQPGAEAGWRRGDVTLALLPTRGFPGSAFDVYYEIYNLPAGHPFATEIAVEPLDTLVGIRGVREALGDAFLRFENEPHDSPDGVVPELKRIQTSLPRGRYRLTVTITDRVTGASASRSRFFDVRSPSGGVTMVPALPYQH